MQHGQQLVIMDDIRDVSILIRPEGRMQPLRSACKRLASFSFQSSSGQKAGCNAGTCDAVLRDPSGFQSSSGQKAGCNRMNRILATNVSRFNPHPARRPDATGTTALTGTVNYPFQSSSGQKAGCNPPVCASHNAISDMFQSSSGQKAGCND